jgi:SAM-dependent methyltransferase
MKLTSSPNFALCVATGGQAYVMREVEPYTQFWLDDTERLLFTLFATQGGLDEAEAIDALVRLAAPADPAKLLDLARTAITEMREAGVLLAPTDDLSRYDRSIAQHYREHRPFPRALAERICADAAIGPDSRVLDLASGPGSLALELAQRTSAVTIMELSAAFIAIATEEAARRGVALTAIHESCNRLVQHDGSYDVITISQAIHWLDEAALVRGLCRTMAEHGRFFVVQGALHLPGLHPLAYILGDRTPLGDKAPGPFAEHMRPLYARLGHLFAGLDPRAGQPGAIRPAGIQLFRQPRRIDEGFARAFLADEHIAGLGMSRDHFWRDLSERCAGVAPERMMGVQEWALIQFARDGDGPEAAAWVPGKAETITYP